MTEKFKESIDKGNVFGALLTDLPKVLDCIDHTLLIDKLFAFGVSPLSLKLLYYIYRIKLNKSKSIKILVMEMILSLLYHRVLF